VPTVDISALVNAASVYINEVLNQPRLMFALLAATVAGALIVISTLVKTIIPLRWLAVGSNIGFVIYGAAAPAPMVLLLHLTLLPINIYRAAEMLRLTRRVQAAVAGNGESMGVWLRPFMKAHKFKAGARIFSQGDVADKIYFLATGRIEFLEIKHQIEAGVMFGEVAFFAPDRRRTSGAYCLSDCEVLSLDEDSFKQLYYQNPDFGFQIVSLVAGHLSDDVQRLRALLAQQAEKKRR
jgi:CRP/FNR family cyclic AMP-dependent transcriptional regulator